jgi:hypothetical protein
MYISGVNDTSYKQFGGANNTCDKFISGVNDTGNLCHGFLVIGDVVDTGNIFITGVIDTGDKLVTGCQRHWC